MTDQPIDMGFMSLPARIQAEAAYWAAQRSTRSDTVDLYLANGTKLGRVESIAVQVMEANGKPPEVLLWGDRIFARNTDGRYVEGLAWAITDTEHNRLVLG